MTVAASKADLRKLLQSRRADAVQGADSEAARTRLLAHVRAIPAIEVVSGYVAMRSEIDPMPVLTALSALGCTVCLPVVRGKGLPLEFRVWRPGGALVPGVFGAAVPDTAETAEPELLITPLLGFDRQCYRLGYGGGFYDRTLEQLRARRRTYAIGFAYEAQAVEALPLEPTDQALDAVVTEAATHYPR